MANASIYLQRRYAEEYDRDRFGGDFGRSLHEQEVEILLSAIAGVPGNILDVGAGTGKLSLPLLRQSRLVTSLDFSPEMLKIARRKAVEEAVTLAPVTCDAHHLCFRDNAFGCVVSSRMLMHLSDWRKGVAELCRVSHDVVVIDFPPLLSFSALGSFIKKFHSMFSPDVIPYKTFSTRSIITELQKHHFHPVLVQKFFFLPITFHRWLNRPQISWIIERVCKQLGLVWLFGSPVTVKAVKTKKEQIHMDNKHPWQLKMFDKTLKKKMKVKHLKQFLGTLADEQCLMVTCGDNNGAMNYHLREVGGRWIWADFEEGGIHQVKELLNESVIQLDKNDCKIPFPDDFFDCVVSVDCHEHLEDPISYTKELRRIIKPSGRLIVSVPNGDERMLAVRIKNLIGMTKEKYGHLVTGYDIPVLSHLLGEAEFKPVASISYTKFFTEMIELGINFAYVMCLSKKSAVKIEEGTIAPSNREQLESVSKSYKVYRSIYPFLRMASSLDALLFFAKGYAVMVEARKE